MDTNELHNGLYADHKEELDEEWHETFDYHRPGRSRSSPFG